MKEVTRVHIAKQAYDIELAAKKDLETYMKTLEQYAEDADLLYDIEIRITELLAERGVAPGGVIAVDDVAGVRGQLGEPSDFAPEGGKGDVGAAEANEPVESEARRVYRDTDNAIIGGVMAGFARFFGIDPLWVRLIFIVLMFASFGTVLIIYVILWFIVPPAQTAAQKLQMRGQAVTLASIKSLVASEPNIERSARLRRWLFNVTGVVMSMVGVLALVVSVVVFGAVLLGSASLPVLSELGLSDSWWSMSALSLLALAGVLFAALCFVLADATFRRRWSRRIGTAVVAIIVAGLTSAGAAAVLGYGGVQSEWQRVQDSVVGKTVELPADFAQIKKMTVSAHAVRSTSGVSSELMVEYVVDERGGPARYELTALPGLEPEIVIEGDEARVTFKSTALHNRFQGWVQPRLVIRGPAIEEIELHQGSLSYSAAYPDGQAALSLQAGATTRATVIGKYDQLNVQGDGMIDASSSRVSGLIVDMNGGSVTAGTVRTLEVLQPEVCLASGPYSHEFARVQVQAVSSGELTFNGKDQPAKIIRHSCGAVVVGGEDYQDN